MLLTRDQILGAKDLTTDDVPVPEWAPEDAPNKNEYVVRIRTLMATDRDKFEASTVEQRGNKTRQNLENFRARLVSMCIINEAGEVMFNPKDIPALGQKSAKALGKVFDACQKLNGFTEADVAELTEGFDDAPNGGSTTD
ncbi:hypothetical protein [Streptomyces chartreusis]